MVVTQGFSTEHLAVDFVSSVEPTPLLRAPFPGRVTFAARDNRIELAQNPEWDRGWYVGIDHDDGRSSRWCHLQEGTLLVHVGQRLDQGDYIGRMGWTGYVRPAGPGGTHCHGGVVDPDGLPEDWRPLLGV